METTEKHLARLDRKIDTLQTRQQRLYAKARNARINRAKKMFLNAKWELDKDLGLHVTDTKLAKALCALEEETEFDFGFCFGNKEPWSLLRSFYFHTDPDPEDENDQRLTGEISCRLNDELYGRVGTGAPLLVARSILERLIPHFKNLRTDLPTISYKIAEASMELDKLLALVREHNKYKRRK
jgi:hypothetical protein